MEAAPATRWPGRPSHCIMGRPGIVSRDPGVVDMGRTMNMMLIRTLVAISTLAATSPELAADEDRPIVTAVKAARLFDGKSDELVRPGVVLVEGSRVVAAGAGVPIPKGARVIDLGDATLAPGFI